MNHLEFLRDRFGGSNWVLARRSANIVAKYGEDVICVSRQRYAAVEKEYRALHGDPYDKIRAELYCCLLDLYDCAPTMPEPLKSRVQAALAAERNA